MSLQSLGPEPPVARPGSLDEVDFPIDRRLLQTLAAQNRDRAAVEATALRSRAITMRAVLAFHATHGELLYQELEERLRAAPDSVPPLDPEWAVALARVTAMQTSAPHDLDLARRIMQSLPVSTLKERHTSFYAKLCFELGDYAECRRLLRRKHRRPIPGKDALEVDLRNPRTASPFGDERVWTQAFGSLFTAHGLEAPEVLPGHGPALDRLHLDLGSTVDGPLISVVLTTFRPDERIFTAANSVLKQTWRNLELIVVDDASGREYDPLLEQVEALDPRVRVLRQESNGGTYLARNAGLAVARGEYMTGQDDDDWSHPRRLEWQFRAFRDEPETTAVRGRALMADNDLVLNRLGHPVLGLLSSSYMAPVDLVRRIGGYLEARKGADTELTRRVAAITGQPLTDLRMPLAVVRVSPGSLSRAEFGPGWHHPVRAAFWSTARLAHERAARGHLDEASVRRNIAVPHRYQIHRAPLRRYDVVLAADWRESGASHHPLLDEVEAVISTGARVGLLHIADNRHPQRTRLEIDHSIQDLVNDRLVDRLLLDDEAPVRTVLVLEAGVLQFPSEGAVRMQAERVVVVANELADDGSRVAFAVQDCDQNARRIFNLEPFWVARTHTALAGLRDVVEPSRLSNALLTPTIHAARWQLPLRAPRSRRPVIGHHARNAGDWPVEASDLAEAYPTNGSVDVRIAGTATSALERLGLERVPPSWVVHSDAERHARLFLHQLDFYVDMRAAASSADRLLGAALASGRVVILPPSAAADYGDAAVYAEPRELQELVHRLHQDHVKYLVQARRARAYARAALSSVKYLGRLADLGVLR